MTRMSVPPAVAGGSTETLPARERRWYWTDLARVYPCKFAAHKEPYSLTKARDVIMAFQSVSI